MTITKQFEGFNQEELNFLYDTILDLAEYGRDKYEKHKAISKFLKDFSDLTEAHFPDSKTKIIPLEDDNMLSSTSEKITKIKEELDKYENLLSKLKPLIDIINEKD